MSFILWWRRKSSGEVCWYTVLLEYRGYFCIEDSHRLWLLLIWWKRIIGVSRIVLVMWGGVDPMSVPIWDSKGNWRNIRMCWSRMARKMLWRGEVGPRHQNNENITLTIIVNKQSSQSRRYFLRLTTWVALSWNQRSSISSPSSNNHHHQRNQVRHHAVPTVRKSVHHQLISSSTAPVASPSNHLNLKV